MLTTPRYQGAPAGGLSRYARWARREHSEQKRVLVLVFAAGPVFLVLLPFVVAVVGRHVDRRLDLPPIRTGRAGGIAGGLLSVLGLSVGFWSVEAQVSRGRGTPLPVMPTQALLTDGPFRYCRNPMTLGAIVAYLGVAIAARTTAGALLVASMAGVLLTYLKRFEEGELAERFGDDYLAYKRDTPFIVPRLPGRRSVTAG